MLPVPCRVLRRRRELPGTVTLVIGAVSGGPPLHMRPGQFAMLYAFGTGEVPISLSGGGEGRLHHTIRSVGAVSEALARAKRGDHIGFRGPFGTAWPLEDAEGGDLVLVAGGIGLAPLRPVVEAVARRRRRYGRVMLLAGARRSSQFLFAREFPRWSTRHGIEIALAVDAAEGGYAGRVGPVTDLIPGAGFAPGAATAFICGPEIMMRLAAEALAAHGLPPGRIHVSMERNMKCAVGFCGHCQLGPEFVCRDGPVFPWQRVERLLRIPEV